jgi:hypothetical protein
MNRLWCVYHLSLISIFVHNQRFNSAWLPEIEHRRYQMIVTAYISKVSNDATVSVKALTVLTYYMAVRCWTRTSRYNWWWTAASECAGRTVHRRPPRTATGTRWHIVVRGPQVHVKVHKWWSCRTQSTTHKTRYERPAAMNSSGSSLSLTATCII